MAASMPLAELDALFVALQHRAFRESFEPAMRTAGGCAMMIRMSRTVWRRISPERRADFSDGVSAPGEGGSVSNRSRNGKCGVKKTGLFC
jgi:hypothetical protein